MKRSVEFGSAHLVGLINPPFRVSGGFSAHLSGIDQPTSVDSSPFLSYCWELLWVAAGCNSEMARRLQALVVVALSLGSNLEHRAGGGGELPGRRGELSPKGCVPKGA